MEISRVEQIVRRSFTQRFGLIDEVVLTDPVSNGDVPLGYYSFSHFGKISFRSHLHPDVHIFVKRSKDDYSFNFPPDQVKCEDLAKFNQQEIIFFSLLVPSLTHFVSQYRSMDEFPIPICYVSQMDNSLHSLLVMEDLIMAGYESRTSATLSLTHKEHITIINAFAELQAWIAVYADSLSLKVKDLLPSVMDRHLILEKTISPSECHKSAEIYASELLSDVDIESVERMKMFIGQHYYHYFLNQYNRSTIFTGLRHNDFWPKNFLFTNDKATNKSKVKVVDWQTWGYGNIVWDIALLLMATSENIERSLSEPILTPLLESFVQIWNNIWKEYGKEPSNKWTVEELRNELYESIHMGYFVILSSRDVTVHTFPRETVKRYATSMCYVINNFPPKEIKNDF